LVLETGKKQQEIRTDKVLLTGNRRPVYESLNLEAAGLSPTEGVLGHNTNLETKAKGVYLVGDATGAPYLAHKAIAQGLRTADHILGKDSGDRTALFPYCIYGTPEVASVGLTEEEAEDADRNVQVGQFRFIGNGRAGTIGNVEGEVSIVSDADTGQVLGVHMIGPQSTELIPLATLAMQNGVDVAGIKKTVFPHPTLAETFFEAALATDGEAIHMHLDNH
jgi:dihydrolipoamide dehydrogenase